MVQKTDSGRIIPDLWTVFTPFCGVKNGRGFQQFIPNWLQIESEKTARKGQEIYLNCLEVDFNVQTLAYLIKRKFCQICLLFTLLDYNSLIKTYFKAKLIKSNRKLKTMLFFRIFRLYVQTMSSYHNSTAFYKNLTGTDLGCSSDKMNKI